MSVASELVELFQTTRFDALQAEKNGNYAEALRLWIVLEGYVESSPDRELDGDALRWRPSIATHVARLQKIVGAGRGIQTQPIEYRRPGPPTGE